MEVNEFKKITLYIYLNTVYTYHLIQFAEYGSIIDYWVIHLADSNFIVLTPVFFACKTQLYFIVLTRIPGGSIYAKTVL